MGIIKSLFEREPKEDVISIVKDFTVQLTTQSRALAKFASDQYPSVIIECFLMEILSYNYAALPFGGNRDLSESYVSITCKYKDAATIFADLFSEYMKGIGERIKTKESLFAFYLYLNNWKQADTLFEYRFRYIIENNDCAPVEWREFDELPENEDAASLAHALIQYLNEG